MPNKAKPKKPVIPVALNHQQAPFPPTPTPHKIGLVFFNMGGPDSLDAVQPFLYNLFADNDIVQMPIPPWLQKLFAWRVSHKRIETNILAPKHFWKLNLPMKRR